MPDVLIRGLSTDAVERVDAEAEALGLSRNEYLRRKFETNPPASAAPLQPPVTCSIRR